MHTLTEIKELIARERYVLANEHKVKTIGVFGSYVRNKARRGSDLDLLVEFNEQKTPEALLCHDADQLALLLQLKEHKDLGSRYADEWLRNNAKRLQTDAAKGMAEAILQTDLSAWWYKEGDADWWIKGK